MILTHLPARDAVFCKIRQVCSKLPQGSLYTGDGEQHESKTIYFSTVAEIEPVFNRVDDNLAGVRHVSGGECVFFS
jgi:hypothetical protein